MARQQIITHHNLADARRRAQEIALTEGSTQKELKAALDRAQIPHEAKSSRDDLVKLAMGQDLEPVESKRATSTGNPPATPAT